MTTKNVDVTVVTTNGTACVKATPSTLDLKKVSGAVTITWTLKTAGYNFLPTSPYGIVIAGGGDFCSWTLGTDSKGRPYVTCIDANADHQDHTYTVTVRDASGAQVTSDPTIKDN